MEDAFGRVDTVLVLGGASEIGVAIARRLAAAGARRVVLAGPHSDTLARAAAGFPDGVAVCCERFDARAVGEHPGFFARMVATYGDLDVVVVAFGVLPEEEAARSDVAVVVACAEVNFLGAVSASFLAAERLRQQGHGSLVVLSSVAGVRVRPANACYGATKAGIDAFAQGLGFLLEGSGAHVLVVRPGFVRTKMTAGRRPAPWAVDAEAVAAATVEGLRARRAVVWVPAGMRLVAAVLRLLPRAVVRRLPR